jgi:hypothetical protein
MLVSCLVYYMNLKMKATCSSETLADFQQTMWCYIQEELVITTAVRTSNLVWPVFICIKDKAIHITGHGGPYGSETRTFSKTIG